MNDQANNLPQRSRPARGVRTFLDKPTIVYVTVCTENRLRWLANETAHAFLVRQWPNATDWHVGRYMLMPDHVHFFCAPANAETTLDNWVKYWKRSWSKELKRPDRRWQPGKWDTRLRHGDSYHDKWEYVRQNPVRAGLVESPEDWPYQGELHELRW